MPCLTQDSAAIIYSFPNWKYLCLTNLCNPVQDNRPNIAIINTILCLGLEHFQLMQIVSYNGKKARCTISDILCKTIFTLPPRILIQSLQLFHNCRNNCNSTMVIDIRPPFNNLVNIFYLIHQYQINSPLIPKWDITSVSMASFDKSV